MDASNVQYVIIYIDSNTLHVLFYMDYYTRVDPI